MLKNGQTYFKNLVVFTPQDFKSMFGHLSTFIYCNRGFPNTYKQRYWRSQYHGKTLHFPIQHETNLVMFNSFYEQLFKKEMERFQF